MIGVTTSLVPEAHVRMGPTTALAPAARVKVNAWGVVARFTDAVKSAVSALPVAKLASIAKPIRQAKPVQRQRIEIVEPTKPAQRAKQAKLSGSFEPVTSGDGPMAAALKRAYQKMQAKAA